MKEKEFTDDETCYLEEQWETGKLPQDFILQNRYKILGLLGKGGMGAVYKAQDLRLQNSIVAIKEMSTQALGAENLSEAIKAFENEAAMLITLRHPALPRITDFFNQGENRWYLVMDYIEGGNLSNIIQKRGKIPEEEVVNWLYQLGEVLDYLHNQNPQIIFRDLKPSNVMLTPDNKLKLIDFGIARHFQPDNTSDTTLYVSHGFSPPEQYGLSQTDIRSDIYALGALLHYALTGLNPQEQLFQFVPPKELVPVSDQLNALIMKAVEYHPEARPANIKELMALMEQGVTGTVPPEEKAQTFGRKKFISVVILGMVLILGGVYLTSSFLKGDKVLETGVPTGTNAPVARKNLVDIKLELEKDRIIVGETILVDWDIIMYPHDAEPPEINLYVNNPEAAEFISDDRLIGLSPGKVTLIAEVGEKKWIANFEVVPAEENLEFGQYLSFGTYAQSPILWRILDSNEQGVLLVTDRILFWDTFGENNKWKESHLRKWLNNETDGFLALFSPAQRNLINNVKISTKYNGTYEKKKDGDVIATEGIASTKIAEYFTEDKVFILSELEYQEYLVTETLDFGKAKIFKVSDRLVPYWLRSMDDIYSHSGYELPANACLYVDEEGETQRLKNGVLVDNLVQSTAKAGVRPALYLKDLDIIEGSGTADNPFIMEE